MSASVPPSTPSSTKNDLPHLLRILTTTTTGGGRSKLPLPTAMSHLQALQAANLRSMTDIANAPLATLTTTLKGDAKAAKLLLAGCKAALKDADGGGSASRKRAGEVGGEEEVKRRRGDVDDGGRGGGGGSEGYGIDDSTSRTPVQLEASLRLPPSIRSEALINDTVLLTNRAPLVLAFAVTVLKYTMPEQPLSSRLSLGMAVVSANSRSKAVSLGIEKAGAGVEMGTGQPRVKVLGREVGVLKRGGYFWQEEEEEGSTGKEQLAGQKAQNLEDKADPEKKSLQQPFTTPPPPQWLVSTPITLKKSTFTARLTTITSRSDARTKLTTLIATTPSVSSASHNISAFRVRNAGFLAGIVEESDDDGETGGGRHVLKMLRDAGVWGVLVVLSRWYGGVMLGPDRWVCMSRCVAEVLAERGRVGGGVVIMGGGGGGEGNGGGGGGGEALWGLDLEGDGDGGSGLGWHKPESARAYLLKSFAHAPSQLKDAVEAGGASETSKAKNAKKEKKKTAAELVIEKERNLGLLLGALELLFESWAGVVTKEELDRRAWGWYVRVRPEVEEGKGGWGMKGEVRLGEVLGLRRGV